MSTGKTITTYLVDSNPQGIKIAFISNRICQCLAIPRGMLKEAGERPELHFPSLYLLLGEDENDEKRAYIGETENFLARIVEHNRLKDFWNEALVFSARDKSLNKADVKYLEYLAIQQVKKTGGYRLDENKSFPIKPSMPEHQRDTVIEFFQDVQMLSSFLGYRLFDEQKTPSDNATLYCKHKSGTDARGIYEGKDFRVLAGSKVQKGTVSSFRKAEERNEQLMREEFATKHDNYFILNNDMIFSSPSAASAFCLGRTSNGWTKWKDQNGHTLDRLVRNKK